MGITEYTDNCVQYLLINKNAGKDDIMVGGVRNKDGSVFGTYIHGIFDNIKFTTGLINNLRKKKGLGKIIGNELNFKEFKEIQYNTLVEILRANLDIEAIYKILQQH
jgi:adenosylcobyric acid synthase